MPRCLISVSDVSISEHFKGFTFHSQRISVETKLLSVLKYPAIEDCNGKIFRVLPEIFQVNA
jgi:hypothetical protein